MQATLARVNARVITLEQQMAPLELGDELGLPDVPTAEPGAAAAAGSVTRAAPPARPPAPAAANASEGGFLSSVTSTVVGKIKDLAALGGDGEQYKFGDVTRGLVKMVRGDTAATRPPRPAPPPPGSAYDTAVDAQVLLDIAAGVKLFNIRGSDPSQIRHPDTVRMISSQHPLRALAAAGSPPFYFFIYYYYYYYYYFL